MVASVLSVFSLPLPVLVRALTVVPLREGTFAKASISASGRTCTRAAARRRIGARAPNRRCLAAHPRRNRKPRNDAQV